MKKFNKEEQLVAFIKECIDNNGYPPTVREMCRAINVNSTSTVAYYIDKLVEDGILKRNPNKNRALEIVGNVTSKDTGDFVQIPLVGNIAAGVPIMAVENVEEYFMFTPNLFKGEGLFMLTVCGDSMINAGIYNGDKIVIRQQATADNGEIVAAMIDGSATVKRFYKEEGRFRLQPENDAMEPIYTTEVSILGKVVGLLRKF